MQRPGCLPCNSPDPARGLVETKNINEHYNLFPYDNSLSCAFAVSQNRTKEFDLEVGHLTPANNEIIASDHQAPWSCTLI